MMPPLCNIPPALSAWYLFRLWSWGPQGDVSNTDSIWEANLLFFIYNRQFFPSPVYLVFVKCGWWSYKEHQRLNKWAADLKWKRLFSKGRMLFHYQMTCLWLFTCAYLCACCNLGIHYDQEKINIQFGQNPLHLLWTFFLFVQLKI